MAEFKRENPLCSFTVPDTVTVRQQLKYFSQIGVSRSPEMWERYWNGAKSLISDWSCDLFPDMDGDLDAVTDMKITELIIWAGALVKQHMDGLETLPKN